VEITGSSIRRLSSETALPVSVIKIEELTKLGVTTTEQAVARIASNQSSLGASSSIGGTTGGKAEADLRGLSGPTNANANKTLVLLNGRRLANHAFDAAAVDLNAIPLSAIDRIEVLRDGASALYGTDAIGGVINFITRLAGGPALQRFRGSRLAQAGRARRSRPAVLQVRDHRYLARGHRLGHQRYGIPWRPERVRAFGPELRPTELDPPEHERRQHRCVPELSL
jgi:outer membrane receptor protein involved in Fe transport